MKSGETHQPVNKSTDQPPLIVTLKINDDAQQFFDEQRNTYFPAHVNYISSHITLFHKLPSDEKMIDDVLNELSKRESFSIKISGIKNIGNGTVYMIDSPELQELHKQMQQRFDQFLISQDRQKMMPHITVQNKVTAYKAKLTTEKLQQGFSPFEVMATGFESWLYLKGPWQHAQDFVFN